MKRIAAIVALAFVAVAVELTQPAGPVRDALFGIAAMWGVGLYYGFRLKRFLVAGAMFVALTWLFTLPFFKTTGFNIAFGVIMGATFFGVCTWNWLKHGDIAGSHRA